MPTSRYSIKTNHNPNR